MSIAFSNIPLSKVDLSLLKYFSVVATFRGFSKAGRATGISQPALSQGVQKLEKSLGIILIDRVNSEFSLTGPGVKLFSFCQRLEGNLDHVFAEIGVNLASPRRRYRIGTAYSVGYSPLISVCQEADKRNGTIEFEIKTKTSLQLILDLKAGLIDAALLPDEISSQHLKFFKLIDDKLIFVLGKKNRKSFHSTPWKRAIRETTFFTYPPETPTRHFVDHLCTKENLTFKKIVSLDDVEAMKTLIAKGLGCGFIMRSLISEELASGDLFEDDTVPFSFPKRSLMLAVRKEDENGELASIVKTACVKRN